MSRPLKSCVILATLTCFGLFLHELTHFLRYGHFVPFGLHADVSIATSNDVIGVEGIAKIYRARLTNYGVLPTTVAVCAELIANSPETEVNYIVERWDSQSSTWKAVPDWDFGGYRLFCRPVFESSDEHRVRQRLWPGQSIPVGEGIPGQICGFHLGEDGRFTIFLNADGDKTQSISTESFRVDQEPKKTYIISTPD